MVIVNPVISVQVELAPVTEQFASNTSARYHSSFLKSGLGATYQSTKKVHTETAARSQANRPTRIS